MAIPNLVRHGLCRNFGTGFNSEAINMLYKHVKYSPEEISEMIRETWNYIKLENKSNHVVSHFLYLLESEVNREWVMDISLEIVKYGLNHEDTEVVDRAIGLIETWDDEDLFDLLNNTEIKTEWLHNYKLSVLGERKES